ncbi:putative bifunctional diguanylate cyclase/phosphodiesterase [Pleomorphomonas sp. PLEO]|uniref:putative bifunctional diguanylate cyclase/phosphodiesterase n=1 Tax=Pleomorphomonas sp. PLEO TaxID=3239306 RepID=UPI00351E50EC
MAFTAFIVVGTTSTALTQNFSYAPANLMFMLPALPPTAVALFATEKWAAGIIGADILLLIWLFARQAFSNARAFCDNERLRLSALSMASSLAGANREITAANARLHQLATHDVLTGLHNRAAFNDELERRIRDLTGGEDEMALAIVDLDNFKVINDTQGHAAGDQALRNIAVRFGTLCRPEQFLARLGGDEFAVIVPGPDALGVATALANSLIAQVGEPFEVGGHPVVGASVGLALFPRHARSPNELFASADIALYDAKRRGKNRAALFDNALKQALERQQRIESDIANAIADEQLGVVFQPQVDLQTGRTLGHEALVRWSHPELGNVAPPEIVAAAQNTYVDDRLTAYVLGRACDFVDGLSAKGDGTTVVAVNVSPVEFRRTSPARTIIEALTLRGIDPRRIEIEITEEAILDFDLAEADLSRLADIGVRIALDDFGAGYFSLASVSALPLHRLKIDRSFITGIDGSPRHQLVVENILALARKLGVCAVAEGIETEAEARTLRHLGCMEGQGYLFCRPLDAAAALDRLAPPDAIAPG